MAIAVGVAGDHGGSGRARRGGPAGVVRRARCLSCGALPAATAMGASASGVIAGMTIGVGGAIGVGTEIALGTAVAFDRACGGAGGGLLVARLGRAPSLG